MKKEIYTKGILITRIENRVSITMAVQNPLANQLGGILFIRNLLIQKKKL